MTTQTPSRSQSSLPLHTLQREIIVASAVWILIAAVCVLIANAFILGHS